MFPQNPENLVSSELVHSRSPRNSVDMVFLLVQRQQPPRLCTICNIVIFSWIVFVCVIISCYYILITFSHSVEDMQAYVDAGLTTFDMADIYGPAEEIFGQFNSQVHTQTHTM